MERKTGPGVVLAILLVLGAALLTLRPLDPERTGAPGITQHDPTGGPDAAVIVAQRETGGISLLGFTFGHVSRTVSVQFLTPPGCAARVAVGDSWPTPFAECATPVSIAGVVSGGGIAAAGASMVVVDTAVDEGCFESIGPGDTWPPAVVECLDSRPRL